MVRKSAVVLILLLFIATVIAAFGKLEKTKDKIVPSSNSKEESDVVENAADERMKDGMEENSVKQIKVQFKTNEIIYELNNSPAAEALYNQLPISVDTEDFSTNEKIFYPKEQLDISDTPMAEGGEGVLAYYEPWGNVVMFYDSFNGNGALYELGMAVSGTELIHSIGGSVIVDKVERNQ